MPRQNFPGSTAIASAEYDPERQELTVVFKGTGRAYTYHQVPPDVYEQLAAADSPGRFWQNSIKDQFS